MSKTDRRDANRTRINQHITAREVLLIDQSGEKLGVVSTREALSAAEAAELDLVEIAPNAEPPVCRIMDYGKYQYELSKKRAKARKTQTLIQVKEIKFRPVTEEGDYQVKLRNLRKFLSNGDKAKVTIRFRGREMAHQELGSRILERVKEDLRDVSIVEFEPKREGRQLVMVLAPQKKQ